MIKGNHVTGLMKRDLPHTSNYMNLEDHTYQVTYKPEIFHLAMCVEDPL